MLVADSRALEELVEELRGVGAFAIDTEFVRERYYRPRLCLVQIALPDKVLLVDPFQVKDLTCLANALADPGIEKIVHSGQQDMETFFAVAKILPQNVFDTQVAAALVGIGQQISYARLTETLLSVRLNKTETFTDWAKRPLTPQQIDYALNDVRYLWPLRNALEDKLRTLGRLDWLRDELKFYKERTSYEKPAHELYKRVKGAAKLEPRELAVLRELAAWREEEAESVDKPRGRILSDELMVEIARREPRHLDSLKHLRGIHPRFLRRSGSEILRRVDKARRLPPSSYPPAIPRLVEDKELSLVVDLLEVVLRTRAAEAEIAPACLGTRKDIQRLARRHLRPQKGATGKPLRILSGWRRKLVGESLLTVLAGKSRVTVNPTRGRVDVVEG